MTLPDSINGMPPAPSGESPLVSLADFAPQLERLLARTLNFEMHCQPIVDFNHGAIAGYEALARFPSEVGLAPDRCLEAAAALGRRHELEELLARKAIDLRERLPQNTFLSINVSPAFFVSDRWSRVLEEAGNVDGLVFEITEQDIITDYAAVRREARRLRKAGGSLAVDDTGAGYASLKHVMELRPDFIKLDRLFISNCHLEPAKREMIELLGDTANRLDAWIVAEGIETQSELDELLRLGVPLGQGYFLGRPDVGMRPLGAATTEAVSERRRAIDDKRSLYPHAEGCATSNSVDQAEKMLHEQSQLDAVMVVDRWTRPIELIERHGLVGIRRVPSLMRVQIDSHPEEVLARVLTRLSPGCYDTIAATNEEGRLQGIVRIDRLMRSVLKQKPSSVVSRLTHPASATRLTAYPPNSGLVH